VFYRVALALSFAFVNEASSAQSSRGEWCVSGSEVRKECIVPGQVKPEQTDTAAVFRSVRQSIADDESARSLWRKLEDEISTGGVGGAISYLRARFRELSDRARVAQQ
jgi:hypothetical protein